MCFMSLPGLERRYYAASMGYLPTVERIHYADFSVPYMRHTFLLYVTLFTPYFNEKDTDETFGKYPTF